MRTELNLTGNDLLVYAIIYSFSQTDNQKFTGSLQYLADWCGATKQGISKNLKNLINKGLIIKTEPINKGGIPEYYTTKFNTPLNKVEYLQDEVLNKVEYPIKQSLTNNIVNTKKEENNKKDNKEDSGKQNPDSFLGSAKTISENTKQDDIDKFLIAYQMYCFNLPKVRSITDKRKKQIQNILNKYNWEEDIVPVLQKANESDFLTGNNDRGWKADIDFILREDKFINILEGKYGGKKKKRFNLEGESHPITDEQRRKDEEWRKEMEAKGEQTVF